MILGSQKDFPKMESEYVIYVDANPGKQETIPYLITKTDLDKSHKMQIEFFERIKNNGSSV